MVVCICRICWDCCSRRKLPIMMKWYPKKGQADFAQRNDNNILYKRNTFRALMHWNTLDDICEKRSAPRSNIDFTWTDAGSVSLHQPLSLFYYLLTVVCCVCSVPFYFRKMLMLMNCRLRSSYSSRHHDDSQSGQRRRRWRRRRQMLTSNTQAVSAQGNLIIWCYYTINEWMASRRRKYRRVIVILLWTVNTVLCACGWFDGNVTKIEDADLCLAIKTACAFPLISSFAFFETDLWFDGRITLTTHMYSLKVAESCGLNVQHERHSNRI